VRLLHRQGGVFQQTLSCLIRLRLNGCGDQMGSDIRKPTDRIMVRVRPEVKAIIRNEASRYSLSAPAYLEESGTRLRAEKHNRSPSRRSVG